MLIVTPAFGSMPEPRPQQLITGDRALQLLDTQSSAALQAAGVKLATVSITSYNNLVATLTPELFAGLDPTTGKLLDAVMPDRLSVAAINAIDTLGSDNKIITRFLPDYLTPTGINSVIAASSAVQFTTDNDGTPVILGLAPPSTNAQTFTGTVTAPTFTGGTTHGDLITGTLAQITTVEQSMALFDNQSVALGSPTSGSTKVYTDGNSRLKVLDSGGTIYSVGNRRTVTTLPAAGASQLGDEVIISATGEHRIYKGSTIGWVLASPLQVPDIATRNAIVSPYVGMKVFVTSSNQDHVYKSDGLWHGTLPTFFAGGTPQTTASVNNTNFQTWNLTNFADPGYKYRLVGRVGLQVVQANPTSRVEVWVNAADYSTGANGKTIDVAYQDYKDPNRHFVLAPFTNFDITGAKSILINWRCTANNANASSGNYQAYNDWMMVPV